VSLPLDLAGSLRHLPEVELVCLAEAVAAEHRRRGLEAPESLSGTPKIDNATAPRSTAECGADDAATLPLTAAQISLIRSSIKAGVTPPVLSRQFGRSRAQIRAALEGQKKGQREAGPGQAVEARACLEAGRSFAPGETSLEPNPGFRRPARGDRTTDTTAPADHHHILRASLPDSGTFRERLASLWGGPCGRNGPSTSLA
jgi:hypothetical protein